MRLSLGEQFTTFRTHWYLLECQQLLTQWQPHLR